MPYTKMTLRRENVKGQMEPDVGEFFRFKLLFRYVRRQWQRVGIVRKRGGV